MKGTARNRLRSVSARPAKRFIVFKPERGVLSEHTSLTDAVAAYLTALPRESPFEAPPAVYRQVDFDWERIPEPAC